MAFRSYQVTVPITSVNDPTTEVYEFETGDVEVWLSASGSTAPAINTVELYDPTKSALTFSGTDPFYTQVGPGDFLRVAATTAVTVRVLVRSIST